MAIKTMEMVRKIRDEHYRILKGKSVDEQIAFYQQEAKLGRARAARILTKRPHHSMELQKA